MNLGEQEEEYEIRPTEDPVPEKREQENPTFEEEPELV